MTRSHEIALGPEAEDRLRPWEKSIESELGQRRGEDPWQAGPVPILYPVDVWEDGGMVLVEAEMPGFTPDQIEIRVDRDVLRIRGVRTYQERPGTPCLCERRHTRVERTLELPAEVDESRAKARLQNGVLRLEIPRVEPSQRLRIPIEVG